jgi:protein O-GlcNAc transferase
VFVGASIILWGGFTLIRRSHADLTSMEKGSRLLGTGRSDAAIPYFEAVVSRDPENKRALVLLGNAYLEKEQYAKAAATFTHALQIDPYDADSQFCLGWSQLKLGKNQQAVESLEKAVLLNPQDAEAEDTLGQAYQAVGNKSAADVAFHRAEELKKSPSHKI